MMVEERQQSKHGRDHTSEADETKQPWLSIPRDLLYVDFLGVLVPGLFTVILGTTMIALTVLTVRGIFFVSNGADAPAVGDLLSVLGGTHYELGIATFVSAYIIGTALFRQDTKVPDYLSALQIWLSATNKDRWGLAVQKEGWSAVQNRGETRDPEDDVYKHFSFSFALQYLKRKGELEKFDTQFPYRHMRCYLAARGLMHLVGYIPWCPDVTDSLSRRSKMYINVLKIRLSNLAPGFGRDVLRNEAHVRLATSVWYAATTLSVLGVMCFVANVVVAFVATYFFQLKLNGAPLYNAIAVLFVIVALCFLMRHQLRKCIHYMRVREVVYVLEAVHLASRETHLNFDVSELAVTHGLGNCAKCNHLCSSSTTAS